MENYYNTVVRHYHEESSDSDTTAGYTFTFSNLADAFIQTNLQVR